MSSECPPIFSDTSNVLQNLAPQREWNFWWTKCRKKLQNQGEAASVNFRSTAVFCRLPSGYSEFLKIQWWRHRAGSTPPSGTSRTHLKGSSFRVRFLFQNRCKGVEGAAAQSDSPVDCRDRGRPRRAVRAASRPPLPAPAKKHCVCSAFFSLQFRCSEAAVQMRLRRSYEIGAGRLPIVFYNSITTAQQSHHLRSNHHCCEAASSLAKQS